MIGKIFLFAVVFVAFASGQDIEEFIAKLKADGKYQENPCAGVTGSHFARNNRGCSWYFACDNNNEIIREDRCPGTLRFDFLGQRCVYPEDLECDLDDVVVDPICRPGRGISIVPHPYSCSKFTVCFDGIVNDRDCPAGLHYSPFDNACVDPFLADCNKDKTLCRESIESGLAVLLPNSRDCGSYFVCVGERSVPLRCSPTTQFDPEEGWCDLPENVNCEPAFPEDGLDIPDLVAIDCQGQSGIAVAHPEACEFFFFCVGDRSYLQACGEGLIFDVNTNRCQLAENENTQCILDLVPPPETNLFRELISQIARF